MKVLIISHNPVSNQSNMGKTFLSLFSQFAPEELCQLYIYPTVPNAQRCGSYFRITDKQVLKSIVSFRHPGGVMDPQQIQADMGAFEDSGDEALYRSRKNKSAMRRLMRDAMWKISRWYSPELKKWLDEQNPDCVFVAPGVAKFLHNFALRIVVERKIPLVTYICDEYYFVEPAPGWQDKLRLNMLKDKIELLLSHTDHLAVISQELKDHYQAKFGVKTSVVMTGAAFPVAEAPRLVEMPTAISYFGNIRCNRFVSLGQIGEALDAINAREGSDYHLDIYTAEKDPEILDSLRRHDSIHLKGFVTGDAFRETLVSSQLLLHTEAFDEASMDFVKHSVSTKIADSLATGIPMVAYGPSEIASMAHLQRNGCAIAANSREVLEQVLLTAFRDGDARKLAAENALVTAKMYHDPDAPGIRIRQILEDLVKD